MDWKELLCTEREVEKNNRLIEAGISEFEKDYFEIVTSSSFRRLQDKTQVYSLDKNDFTRTRLTHSMEVSAIARMLGEKIWTKLDVLFEDNPDAEKYGFDCGFKSDAATILSCAGLLHDIGNPPLGHSGENAIREWFENYFSVGEGKNIALTSQMKNDFTHFEGNAQALRVVLKLHHARNAHHGMKLTYGVINSIIKYPISSEKINEKYDKYGFMYSEREQFAKIVNATGAGEKRNPLVYILEAADDIAYRFADIEDAYKNKMITYADVFEVLKNLKYNPFFNDKTPKEIMESYLTGNSDEENEYIAIEAVMSSLRIGAINYAADNFVLHYREIMEGSFENELINSGDTDEKSLAWIELFKGLKKLSIEKVFIPRDNQLSSLLYSSILKGYLDIFVPRALKYDFNEDILPEIPGYNKELCKKNCENASEEEKNYFKLQMVTDFVSGMTDRYALKNLAGI